MKTVCMFKHISYNGVSGYANLLFLRGRVVAIWLRGLRIQYSYGRHNYDLRSLLVIWPRGLCNQNSYGLYSYGLR